MAHDTPGSALEELQRNFKQLCDGLQPPRKDPPTEKEIVHKQMIVKEAKRAAVAWLVVYVIMLVCLLAYRWQTKGYYQAEYERKLAALENITMSTRKVEPWWTVQEKKVEEAIESIRELKRAQEEKFRGLRQQEKTLEKMKAEIDQLDISVGGSSEKVVKTSPSLNSLLDRAALKQIPNTKALSYLFNQAVDDLKAIVSLSESESVDWEAIQNTLSSEFPDRVASSQESSETLNCPTANNDQGASASIPDEAARMSDLEEQVKEVYAVLNNRAKLREGAIAEALLPETADRLNDSIEKRINETLNMIVSTVTAGSKASRDKRSTGSCVDEEDILGIVEEGLLALQMHADLRNVLRKKIVELDPSASTIILDADLPPPTPKIPARDSMNLRQIIETPIVFKLAGAIDIFVEMVGGYNDQLDQWLDSVAGGRKSVGEMVVRQFLEESGKLEIPTVEAAKGRLPPQVQDLLKMANDLPFL